MKRKIFILIFIILPFALNGQNNQIEIDGIKINLDSVSIEKPYHHKEVLSKQINNPVLDKAQTRDSYIFFSNNKKFLGITSVDISKSTDSYDLSFQNPKLRVYSSDNKILFIDSISDRIPGICLISDDGKYIHTTWRLNSEEGENFNELITYNQNGKKLHIIEDINRVYHGKSLDAVYYTKDASMAGKTEYSKKIFYYNFYTKTTWEKEFNNSPYDVIIDVVSNDGNNIICKADKIYSIDFKSNVLWYCNDPYGFFHFSDDDKFVMQLSKPGQLIVYDNKDGKIVIKKDFLDKQSFEPNEGCFVNNSNDYILALYSKTKTSENIAFVNLKGDILQTVNIRSDKRVSTIRVEIKDKNLIIFINDEMLNDKYKILW